MEVGKTEEYRTEGQADRLHRKSGEDFQPQEGSQSIRRAISLLRAVAKYNDGGVRLSRIARAVGLHIATTRRILRVLVSENLITYDPISKHYHLGFGLFCLGEAAHQFMIRNRFHTALERIASETEDTGYLLIRSGNDSLCIDRIDGSFPIRIMTLDIGGQRPLGFGAGSLALFAFLPDEQVEAILAVNAARIFEFIRLRGFRDVRMEDIRCLVAHSRELGYTLSQDIFIKGVSAVGVPIYNREGKIEASISVAAISERMDHDRCERIAKLVKSEIALVNQPQE
jgi:DNA-binding IclR family transcriptional regulator